ncbi:hypothetical protein DDB_G0276139 [Dictyostelium discoideum AX4]|uniref:Putative uncharacterized protein DDB_G0276139 n=1 Tax=Dictyostelium discoideum TaxID=44689 RepID=Y9532_DICDI|nr:hypothetical protein DDB_G0276139 [Dictyostelium discoideum AX4]Q75JF2.1 RecName: Full=Putative uncharacterized protein DDB_G0276139 [Dictyostelium discoideum]EAL69369.1 hypothetical protein DDB_G0276139 [Dictyostelium discoideum AX4]|eukprot:XP_643242.1 hypothetical protein DDB_G0276139 [Dictyostelium discoideum AX4]
MGELFLLRNIKVAGSMSEQERDEVLEDDDDDEDNKSSQQERDEFVEDDDNNSIQSSPSCAQPLLTQYHDDGSTPLLIPERLQFPTSQNLTPRLIPERLQYPTSQNLTSIKRKTTRLRFGFGEISRVKKTIN